MTPVPPIRKSQIKRLHVLFARIGEAGEAGVRDRIAALTGQRSTKGLDEAQAWALIEELCAKLGEKNPEPIAVEWCRAYSGGATVLGEGNVERLPSRKQVWFLHHALRAAGIHDPVAYFGARFKLRDGLIRTADDAWRVGKALRRMALARRARLAAAQPRPERETDPSLRSG